MDSFSISGDSMIPLPEACRGYGGFGALGHSVYHRELLPRMVKGAWKGKITHVATSGTHTAAVTESGGLYTWGRDEGDGRLGLGGGGGPHETGGLGTPSRVHALPVPAAAAASNSNFELGRGDKVSDWRPQPVPSVQDNCIVQVASGGYHSLALTDQGKVLSWGHGGQGQLGHSSLQNQKVPTVVEALAEERMVFIACGGSSSAAVSDLDSAEIVLTSLGAAVGIEFQDSEEYTKAKMEMQGSEA
ncbi:RCC1 domain-containing protein rug3, mitochondrial [Asimina triloba]